MDESEVPLFVVYDARTEQMRCTRRGAVMLLEAEIVLLVDEAQDYMTCIKGRDLWEAVVHPRHACGIASGDEDAIEDAIEGARTRLLRLFKVCVKSATDDPARMIAALSVIMERNPTGRPPYVLPTEEEEA